MAVEELGGSGGCQHNQKSSEIASEAQRAVVVNKDTGSWYRDVETPHGCCRHPQRCCGDLHGCSISEKCWCGGPMGLESCHFWRG